MSAQKPKGYDTTVARIAGNILSGAYDESALRGIGNSTDFEWERVAARGAVTLARLIVEETKRTEPESAS